LAPFDQAVSEEKIFLTLANQKTELILVAMFVGRMEPNEDALSVNFFIFLSSPLKQLVQMEPNLEVSIYVKSSIKFFHFVPFHQQIWPPRAFLVPDWLHMALGPGELKNDEKRAITPRRVIRFTSKLQGM
jgi:hypothetical protein